MKKILLTGLLMASATLMAQNHTNYELRYPTHPDDVRTYDTNRLRKAFAIEKVFSADKINIVYTMHDRFIVGGAMPVNNKALQLETFEYLKAPNFLSRREIGIINVGGTGTVTVKEGNKEKTYELKYKEALYVGSGKHEVYFASNDPSQPAHFYFNSATAHTSYPARKVTLEDLRKKGCYIEAGSMEESNDRVINQLIVAKSMDNQICQLQMGMTELKPGSVWNTMPAHTHSRRMEAYFYFNVPEKQAVCHFMGEPKETRPIWLHNEQAVISPEWSIHAGAGTSNYIFIWGMAGENLDYNDMDKFGPTNLK